MSEYPSGFTTRLLTSSFCERKLELAEVQRADKKVGVTYRIQRSLVDTSSCGETDRETEH